MTELVFCKVGGSAITDKAQPGTARPEVIARLGGELARALASRPDLRLVLGHGSGSFGHVAAQRHGTRAGVRTPEEWRGFAEVAAAAAALNRIVASTWLASGVPVWTLAPSASARCRAGQLLSLAAGPVRAALEHGLVPLIYGDVALDEVLGGTIVSTEQVLVYLARQLHPARIILVSDVDGVFTEDPAHDTGAQRIAEISATNWQRVRAALGASRATDVTGGMASKIEAMVELAREQPRLIVHVTSGEQPGVLEALITGAPGAEGGTVVRWVA